ncbi:cytochrome P450, partial [Zopfochytrium polystomum]
SLYRLLKSTVFPTRWIFSKDLKRFPGSLPIIGSLVAALKSFNTLHDAFSDALEASNHEPVVFTPTMTEPNLIISDPLLVEHILKTKMENYKKGEFFRSNFRELLGNGIFNADGEQWKRQRKLSSHLFTVKNFKTLVSQAFSESMISLVSVLDAAAENGTTVNLVDLFLRFTMDGFCKVAFGTEINSLKASERPAFAVSFDRTQVNIRLRFAYPFYRLVEPFTSLGRQFQDDVKVVGNFTNDIIERRLRDASSSDALASKDLLTMLARMQDDDGKPIGSTELAQMLLNYIFAGRDSTGLALSWAFLMLERYPAVRARLVEEVDAATAGLAAGETLSYDALRGLPYANAVMCETMRLYPPVAVNVKEAVADDVWPNGMRVPAGTKVWWSPYAQGRSMKLWGSDAREFRPDRWLEMTHSPSPYQYNVFNAGPRMCLGKNFAEMEIVFVLVELLRRFQFKVQDVGRDGKPKTYAAATLLMMGDGELVSTVCRR